MKTFKQHIVEGGTYGVGTPHQSSVEDGSMGAHNIHEPSILQRVNAFVDLLLIESICSLRPLYLN